MGLGIRGLSNRRDTLSGTPHSGHSIAVAMTRFSFPMESHLLIPERIRKNMWSQYKQTAERFEAAVSRWASDPQSSHLAGDCVDLQADLFDLSNVLTASPEQTMLKLRKLERRVPPPPAHLPAICLLISPPPFHRSLAPLRRSISVVRGVMDNETRPSVPTALMGYLTVMASVRPTRMALINQDDSFSSVPASILASIIEPFPFLETLAKHFAGTAAGEWEMLQDPESFGGFALAEYIESTMFQIDGAIETLQSILERHPHGRRLAAQGRICLRPLTAALWALAPMMRWDLGMRCII